MTIFSIRHNATRTRPREKISSCALALTGERVLRLGYRIYHLLCNIL